MIRSSRYVGVGLLLLSSLACGLAPGPIPLPQPVKNTDCPDLSGTYSYPGHTERPRVCRVLTETAFSGPEGSLPVPDRGRQEAGQAVPDGGWRHVELPTRIGVKQTECTELTLYAPITTQYAAKWKDGVIAALRDFDGRYELRENSPEPGKFKVDRWMEVVLPLDTSLPDAELTWDAASLTYRFRFRAAGYGAGTTRNYLTLTLGKLPDGGLLYRLRHDEVPGADREVECRLPPAEGPEEPPSPGE